jgi:hypothetical protein
MSGMMCPHICGKVAGVGTSQSSDEPPVRRPVSFYSVLH